MCESSRNVERHNDPRHTSHLPCRRAVVCSLASLGHDVVAMVRDVQAASRRLPSGIALRVADYEDASALKRALAVLII
jgi:phosphate uptake regulator